MAAGGGDPLLFQNIFGFFGHCGMCHSPSYYILDPELTLLAPIKKYNLAGNLTQGYIAPNITYKNLGTIPDMIFKSTSDKNP